MRKSSIWKSELDWSFASSTLKIRRKRLLVYDNVQWMFIFSTTKERFKDFILLTDFSGGEKNLGQDRKRYIAQMADMDVVVERRALGMAIHDLNYQTNP